MANPDVLFRGIPRGPTRGYTAQVIRALPPARVVIPCCGSFSLAAVARRAGVAATAIVCGDVSLYSTALGQAIVGRDWRLEARGELGEVVRPYLSDPTSKAAAVLFAIRASQYRRKASRVHHADRQRELLTHVEVYLAQFRAQVEALAEALHGLDYRAQDMWLTLETHRHDPQTLLLVNPPRYSGGYERMFAGVDEVFDWDAPQVAQFVEQDYARLMDLLAASEATTLLYYATPQEDPSPLWGAPWRALFADRPGNRRRAAINWVVANREVADPAITRSRIEPGKARYPLFGGEVRPDSDLRALRVAKQVGDYYRDLFIHKLPGSLAETYAVLLLDGYLLAVVGLNLYNYRTGGAKGVDEPANLTFAFTVFHAAYRRLHKLTLRAVTSRWFWNDVYGDEVWYQVAGCPQTLQTTMLTPHPENKTARGVLKLTRREQQPDGTYKLSYHAPIADRASQETLREWLDKYGTSSR
jgi:hypothetical protein